MRNIFVVVCSCLLFRLCLCWTVSKVDNGRVLEPESGPGTEESTPGWRFSETGEKEKAAGMCLHGLGK